MPHFSHPSLEMVFCKIWSGDQGSVFLQNILLSLVSGEDYGPGTWDSWVQTRVLSDTYQESKNKNKQANKTNK